MTTLFEDDAQAALELEQASEGSLLDSYQLPENKTANERYTVKQVALALDAAGGFITYAARVLRCRVETVRAYIKRYPILKELVTVVKDFHLDTSEIALLKKRDAGDNTAIIFHLKCQGKKRGYVDTAVNFNAELDLEKANWKDLVDQATDALNNNDSCDVDDGPTGSDPAIPESSE